MAQHSSDPWVPWFEYDAEGFISRAGIDTAGRVAGIAEVLVETCEYESDKDKWNGLMIADTCLLAAAPELLAALQQIIIADHAASGPAVAGFLPTASRVAALAAIAKTQGY